MSCFVGLDELRGKISLTNCFNLYGSIESSLTNDFNLSSSMNGTDLLEGISSAKIFNLVASGNATNSDFAEFEVSE